MKEQEKSKLRTYSFSYKFAHC